MPRPRHTKASEEAREAFKKDSRQPVHNAVRGTAVPGVLDLAAVLPLIMDALDQGSLAQQHFVQQGHELVFHLALASGNPWQTLRPQLFELLLTEEAAIAKPFAPEWADESSHRAAVIDVAWCQREGSPFALLMNDQCRWKP